MWYDGTTNIPNLDVRKPIDYWDCEDAEMKVNLITVFFRLPFHFMAGRIRSMILLELSIWIPWMTTRKTSHPTTIVMSTLTVIICRTKLGPAHHHMLLVSSSLAFWLVFLSSLHYASFHLRRFMDTENSSGVVLRPQGKIIRTFCLR